MNHLQMRSISDFLQYNDYLFHMYFMYKEHVKNFVDQQEFFIFS